ncbi:MAG: SGNH/GDSL hydrolase family protein [Lachnospiraceae bacterium]
MMKEKQQRKFIKNSLIVMLILIVGLVGYESLRMYRQEKLISQQDRDNWERELEERRKEKERLDHYNIYNKLNEEGEISLCIIGDNIGFQLGRYTTNTGWMDRLKTYLEKTYRVKGNVDSYTFYDWDVFKCYSDFVQRDKEDYDMVFLFFGFNDKDTLSLKEYRAFYEALIRQIQTNCDYPELILVKESVLRDAKEYAKVVDELGKYYDYPVADAITAFQQSEYSVKEMTRDGMHPNDIGYRIYFNVIRKLIDNGVVEQREVVKEQNEKTLYKETRKIGAPMVVSTERMNHSGLTYTFTTEKANIGVSYQGKKYVDGKIDVYINDTKIKTIDCNRKLDVEKADLVGFNLKGTNKVTLKIDPKYQDSTELNGLILY